MSFYTDAVMADNPVAYWRLGESAGTVAHDATANKLDGTYSATGVTKGIVGPLADGTFGVTLARASTGFVQVPYTSLLAPSGGFAAEAWFMVTAYPPTGNAALIEARLSTTNGFCLFLNTTGIVLCEIGTGTAQTQLNGPTASLNTWHHLIASYDGAKASLYMDGALVAGPTATAYSPNPSQNIYLGRNIAGGVFFDGSLDECAIYPGALSAARVLAHYQAASIAPTGAGTWAEPQKLYTYLAANPLTGAIVGDLPLRNVTFDTKLNDAGSFSAELPLADSALVPASMLNSTGPNQTAIWVDRAGSLVWGGLLWTRGYDSTTETLKLGGKDFLSYFTRRLITDTLTFSGVDQLSIVKQLLQYAQGQNASYPKPGGNILLQYANPYPTSPVLSTVTYNSYELKEIAAAIQDLSQQDTGFDFGIDVQYVAGVPTAIFNPAYPRRGRTATQTGWVFELPGNITAYTYDEDGTQTEVTDYALGSGTGSSMFRSSASTTSLTDAGYPLLEGTHSYRDVADQTRLDALSRGNAAAFAGPVALADVTVLGSSFSGPITGDDARLRVTDRRFNKGFNADGTPIGPGLDTFLRIIAIAVTPGDDTLETVKVTLGPALA